MDGALEIISSLCFAAAIVSAAASVVIGVLAWMRTWDARLAGWRTRARSDHRAAAARKEDQLVRSSPVGASAASRSAGRPSEPK